MGNLSALRQWHHDDPPSAEEKLRNEINCLEFQGNRNPFIDNATLVEKIWSVLATNDTSCAVACEDTSAPDDDGATPAPVIAPSPMPTGLGEVGDLVFVSITSDSPDGFTLMALRDLDEGATYHVTDNGWQSDETFRDSEGVLTYTVPAGGLAQGSSLNYTDGDESESGSPWQQR